MAVSCLSPVNTHTLISACKRACIVSGTYDIMNSHHSFLETYIGKQTTHIPDLVIDLQ